MAQEATTVATAIGVPDGRLLQRIPWISDDGIAIVQRAGSPRMAWANPALHTLLGAAPGSLVGIALAELPAAEVDLGSHGASLRPGTAVDLTALLDEAGGTATCSLSRTDGSTVNVSLVAQPLDGDPDGAWVLRVREVAAQIKADALLRSSEERFRALATHAPIGVALSDVGVRLGYVNARLAEMWGHPTEAMLGDAWLTAVLEEDRAALVDALVSVLAGAEERLSIRVAHADGGLRCIDARLTPVRLVGHGAGFVASMEDVTEARDRELRLAWQATHDSLTGLPNRMALRLRADEVLGRSRGDGVALLFFDLDDFKLVNDSLGHQAGDQLLQEVAERFRAGVRTGDLVARLGGDEFVVLCQGILDEGEALLVADRLLEALGQPLHIEETELRISASVGVVLAEDGTLADDLLRDADVAMYQAKNDGKARTAVFEETHRVALQARLELITGLRTALAAGDVGLHYQPVVDLVTGRIVGAEALLRFRHPEQGMVSAAEVVALAEDTGCIVELGAVVLRLATQQLAAWRRAGMGPDYVAVNLAARQFSEPDLLEIVMAALRAADLEPHDLCIELTESHLMAEVDRARANLKGLEQLGVRLAIDDFGAGYSSLSYLRRIPAQTIKIDRSFIDGIDVDPECAAIVGAVTTMCRALGRTAVAEGVETPAQLRAVMDLGCDAVQGYLLGRPVHPDAFPEEVHLP
jgi:diguanylate cyclase (GGDEF)-like protein/PAS domain S-box-containing protein